jgi:release factor glutamine methyltransferase
MNIREAIAYLIKNLRTANIASYSADAMILLKMAIQKDDVFCLSNPDYELSIAEYQKLDKLIQTRIKKYPMAYIVNKKEFYGFEFYVDENVLIPRPETELLIDETLKLAKEFKNPKIVDVGTGSGCIAITLSKLLNMKITASDISESALNIAKKNAKHLMADVEFVKADALTFLKHKVEIIVSNPPYIDKNEYENLQADVKYEPKRALICENGTEVIEEIINQAKTLCRYLVLEIGYDQEVFVKKISGFSYIKMDFSNLPRVAVFKF